MLLFNQDNDPDIRFPEADSEAYQANLDAHQQNARVRVKDTGLMYDAIHLAQCKGLNKWSWRYDQAENHLALLKLCAFWHCFCEQACRHEARIPYIQLFLGGDHYVPLISDTPIIPVYLEDNVFKKTIKRASVLFGDVFLVTFLAGRQMSAKQSKSDHLVYYTVQDQPLFKERLLFGEANRMAFDLQNQLAWQTLNALQGFPKRFPTLWQSLKKQHEIMLYEIH